jgi:uncharacterized protein (DUF486 family)
MDALRYGREIRWHFQAALLIFIATIALGMAAGIGLIEFSPSQALTHLHAGVIGWISLGVVAAGLWLYGGTTPREGSERWVTWSSVLLVGSVPLFVLAWWLDSMPLLAIAGSLVLLGIVAYVVWLLGRAARIGYRRLTTPQLGIALGVVTLVVGSAIGVAIALQEATSAFQLPQTIHLVHAQTQESAYLFLAAMALAYWRLHANDRTARGTWMVWLFFAAGVIIALSLLANSIEGAAAFIPFDIAAFAILLTLAWRRIVSPGWLAAGSARHYAVAIPFAAAYLAIFIYLVLGLTVLRLWADPSQIPSNLIPAVSHPFFVGMVTNVLFGLLIDLTGQRRPLWPWADHVLFWGMNLAVAAFTVAILLEADDWFRLITPILGLSIFVGIAALTARLWSSSEQATPQEVPATT